MGAKQEKRKAYHCRCTVLSPWEANSIYSCCATVFLVQKNYISQPCKSIEKQVY